MSDALAPALSALPLRVREVLPETTNFVVSGDGWRLLVMCPVRYRTPHDVLGWESEDLQDRLWDLIGQDLVAIDVRHGDPVFRFSNGYAIEVFADAAVDPWVLHVPGVVIVGEIPSLED